MKRCPQCRRDYYDETLLYCLDDGTALLDGPASLPSDEPRTALLNNASDPRTAILSDPGTTQGNTSQRSKSGPLKWIVAGVLIVALAVGGYFAYRSYRSRTGDIRSIAVLPFENKSVDADTDYLSDGLGESLIFRLSQLPGLKVSPLSSVSRYKGAEGDVAKIAADLGVDSVMTGRMAKHGDDLSITVELVDVRNNASIWGERYERKMSDLLALQREITTTITQKLQLKLAGNEKGITKKYTDSNEAYQLYLNARFHFQRRTKDEIYKSIDLYQQAVAIDPNFALAYAGLAEAWGVIPSYPYASPAECYPKAKIASARALELDPELPEAHIMAGMIASTYDWDWATAEREFKRALDLDPNLAAAHYRYAWTYLSPLGRHDEAIAEMKKAMDLEPLLLIQGANYAGVLMYARRYDEAIAQARKVVDLDPTFFGGKTWLCHTLIAAGRFDEVLPIAEPTLTSDNPFLSDAALAYAHTGQREKALAIVDRMKEAEKTRYVMNSIVASIYAALGDKDASFSELEKGFQSRDWFIGRLRVDPSMDPLRDDPRFAALEKRFNFPDKQ